MAERKVVGNFSTLNIRVTLTRHISQFVVDYYIPSSMLVCMSWVSFWLEPSAIPGRTTLGHCQLAHLHHLEQGHKL